MKLVTFGWECDNINQKTASVTWPVKKAIILRGYQFDLGLMTINAPLPRLPLVTASAAAEFAELLFSAGFDEMGSAIPEFGPVDVKTGANGMDLHGGDLNNSVFCAAILKTWVATNPIANAVNKVITMSGLDIRVPAGGVLRMNAGHAGFGPMDFECQGTLFYDVAE